MNSKNRKNIITIRSFEKETGIHFTINHTGKMEGMQSLSTSCVCNPVCIARMKDSNSICSHCFAAAMHKRYGNLAIRMEQNYQILSTQNALSDPVMFYLSRPLCAACQQGQRKETPTPGEKRIMAAYRNSAIQPATIP